MNDKLPRADTSAAFDHDYDFRKLPAGLARSTCMASIVAPASAPATAASAASASTTKSSTTAAATSAEALSTASAETSGAFGLGLRFVDLEGAAAEICSI